MMTIDGYRVPRGRNERRFIPYKAAVNLQSEYLAGTCKQSQSDPIILFLQDKQFGRIPIECSSRHTYTWRLFLAGHSLYESL